MCFFENPILLFKALQLVNETLVWVGFLALSLDKLKDILEVGFKELHNKHDGTGGGTRHAHSAVNEDFVFVFGVLVVDCDDGLLNFDVLFVLLVFGFAPGLLLLAIDVQHLVRNGKVRVKDL